MARPFRGHRVVSRVRVADDAEMISARLRELDAERLAMFRCNCPCEIDSCGVLVRLQSATCAVHGWPAAEALAAAGYRVP